MANFPPVSFPASNHIFILLFQTGSFIKISFEFISVFILQGMKFGLLTKFVWNCGRFFGAEDGFRHQPGLQMALVGLGRLRWRGFQEIGGFQERGVLWLESLLVDFYGELNRVLWNFRKSLDSKVWIRKLHCLMFKTTMASFRFTISSATSLWPYCRKVSTAS